MQAYGGNNTRGPVSVSSALSAHGGSGRMDFESETFVAHTLRSAGFDASEDGSGRGTPLVPAVAFGWQNAAAQGMPVDTIAPTLDKSKHPATATAVRRLTPRECERLMGFSDDYTLVPWRGGLAGDGVRYKALGNSWAVNVARWVGWRIACVDAICSERAAA